MQIFFRLEAPQIVIQERVKIYNLKIENNRRLCIFLTVGPRFTWFSAKLSNFLSILEKKLFFNICEFTVTRSRCFGGKLRITMTMAPRGVWEEVYVCTSRAESFQTKARWVTNMMCMKTLGLIKIRTPKLPLLTRQYLRSEKRKKTGYVLV